MYVPPEVTRGAYLQGISTFFPNEVSFRMYLPLDMEVNKGLLIDYLGFMVVDTIKKHLLEPTLSNILTLTINSLLKYGFHEN